MKIENTQIYPFIQILFWKYLNVVDSMCLSNLKKHGLVDCMDKKYGFIKESKIWQVGPCKQPIFHWLQASWKAKGTGENC